MRVPAGGGTPEPVTTLNAAHFDVAHRWPQFLPDGKHFLFYVVSTMNPLASEHTGIYVGSVGSGEPTFLLKSESRALYTRGYLLYRSGSTLMAHRFDAAKLRLTGDPTPLASDIPGGLVSWGGAQFGCTEDVVAYMRGTEAARTLLVWRDRAGNALSTVGDPAGYWEPRLSHDGSRVAVAIGHDVADIWVIDLNSDMRTRLTFDPADDRTPVWSPDDRQLAFSSGRKAEGEIYVRPSSGQGDDTLIYTANAQIALTDWSSDGRFIFFNVATPGTGGFNIWSLDVHTSSATVLLTGNWFEGARLSPDGKWLAFASYESGNGEIYIESFPAHSGRWMVSSDAMPGEASFPAWRNDGRELYYFRGRTVVSVPVSGDAGFSVGKPQGLFTVSVTNASEGAFAVSADGQSILTNELPPADQSKIGARLIQNWMVALER